MTMARGWRCQAVAVVEPCGVGAVASWDGMREEGLSCRWRRQDKGMREGPAPEPCLALFLNRLNGWWPQIDAHTLQGALSTAPILEAVGPPDLLLRTSGQSLCPCSECPCFLCRPYDSFPTLAFHLAYWPLLLLMHKRPVMLAIGLHEPHVPWTP